MMQENKTIYRASSEGKPEFLAAAEMEFPLQRRCGPQKKLLVQVLSEESTMSLSGCV